MPRGLKKPDPQVIDAIFERWRAAIPAPKSDLDYTNNYTLLVAVVLSAQMTDKGVNKATAPLFAHVDTPQKMLDLGVERLTDALKSINHYRNKSKNVIALSRILVDEYEGDIPSTREGLMALPGVGRKTANVVLNVAFGQPTLAVDTHVFRLAHRLGWAKGRTPDEVEEQVTKLLPDRHLQNLNHLMVLHGRYVCTARAPKCDSCVISDLCPKRGVGDK